MGERERVGGSRWEGAGGEGKKKRKGEDDEWDPCRVVGMKKGDKG
jgi:hypothetical protein